MSVHVNCTECGALCQVSDETLGALVRCGKCSKVFRAQTDEQRSTPASGVAAGFQKKIGSIFSGVQNMLKKPETAKESVNESAEEDKANSPESEADIGFDFDAPGADLLDESEECESSSPELGVNPAAIHGLYRLDIGGCTSTGRVRQRNEDSFQIQHQVWSNLDARHEMALVIVADGMGGHDSGDRASKMALHYVGSSLAPIMSSFLTSENKGAKPESYRAPLEAAIKSANAEVFKLAQSESSKSGMGCTAAIVLVRDEQVDIGHVGDCRVYHFRDGALKQITRDQTLVERMIELGQLTREEADRHEASNEVTQAIGIHANVAPGFYNFKLAPGDWLIIACDGLHAHVDGEQLTETLQAAPTSAALVAHYLVDLANHLGGSDNCTVVAVRCF